MLDIIVETLEELLQIQNVSLTNLDRIDLFKTAVNNEYFSRKEYLRNFREISSATASRDLKFAVENGIIKKIGNITLVSKERQDCKKAGGKYSKKGGCFMPKSPAKKKGCSKKY